MTLRPFSSRITAVGSTSGRALLSGLPVAPQGTGHVPGRAEAADVRVVARREPSAGRTARGGVARRYRPQVETRVATVTGDHHASGHVASHVPNINGSVAAPQVGYASRAATLSSLYSACRPLKALPSVISSAYSRSAPTGSPLASRVTATPGARSRSRSAM